MGCVSVGILSADVGRRSPSVIEHGSTMERASHLVQSAALPGSDPEITYVLPCFEQLKGWV